MSARKNPFDEQSGILNTTKANKYKRGFGIKSIRKIVAKYHGNMQICYNQDSLAFHTIITVKQ
ncbi:MAG: ATP-binding protein [Lachnospiraceae bacterium]|nr:ATP-binding protein [Lachnospiraceae bacterium]